MATLTDNTLPSHVDGPIQSTYKLVKNYLPNLSKNQIITTVDSKLSQIIEGCDKVVLSTKTNFNKTIKQIPSPHAVKQFVANSSEKALIKTEKMLDTAITYLGGQVEQTQEKSTQAIMRFINIFAKTLELNSLLIKNTAKQVIHYSQSPSELVNTTKAWTHKLFIEVSAISIVLKQLLIDTTRHFFGGLGAKYTQTKNKVKVLLTNVNEPEKAYNLLTERLIDVKNVTVKRVEEGIEIIMDREHYYDNLKKLASSLLDVLQTISVKADNAIESSTTFTKDLYEKTLRSYKVQKILLSKSPVSSA